MLQDVNEKKCKKVQGVKECAFIAVFVAVVISVQLMLSFVPGVEVVTVLFVSFAYVSGWKRGMLASTVFSLLRQIIFGFYPTVLILYLVYYNLLTLVFGLLGKTIKRMIKYLPLIVLLACLGTVMFAMIDNILTPLWYGFGEKATRAYFMGSLSVMIPQVFCSAITVSTLFLPLAKCFQMFY